MKQSEIISNKKFGFTKQFENIPVYALSKKDRNDIKTYKDVYEASRDFFINGRTKASTQGLVTTSIERAIRTKISAYGYYWLLELPPIEKRP